MYVSHQSENKTEYGPRAKEVEKATLTAAVMSTSVGMGKEMDMLVRQIATKFDSSPTSDFSKSIEKHSADQAVEQWLKLGENCNY